MVEIKLTRKCLECSHIDVKDRVTRQLYGCGVVIVDGYISCHHADVCRDYDESESISRERHGNG